MDQRVAGGPTDSPIPEGFGIPDLMDLVDRLEVRHRSHESHNDFLFICDSCPGGQGGGGWCAEKSDQSHQIPLPLRRVSQVGNVGAKNWFST